MLTEADAITLAGDEARRLAFPWNPRGIEARWRRVWPASAFWIITSSSENPPSKTTMRVFERTRLAVPVGVRYLPTAPRQPAPGQRIRAVRMTIAAVIAGSAAYAIAVLAIGWAWWVSAAIGLIWAVLVPAIWSARLSARGASE